jgi:hypothetical protein
MKKKTIAGITFLVRETRDGLYFEPYKKEDVLLIIKMGANKAVDTILSVLDKKIGKGLFFYESGGGAATSGMKFNLEPGKFVDRL